MGSGFGFRSDPFTGRAALHTGLDFAADPGTPIQAAAGGVVVSTDPHPQYGNLLEIDHGNGLLTRYAHTPRSPWSSTGDLIKRGQPSGPGGQHGPFHRPAPALRGAGGRRAAGSGPLPGGRRPGAALVAHAEAHCHAEAPRRGPTSAESRPLTAPTGAGASHAGCPSSRRSPGLHRRISW
ncbi:MAG: M23 family metallopeptidase [Ideonella sp.]|nr:M23 family metallopeptidase [Ideonella sp.]